MSSTTRQANAEGVLAQLRGVGPQSVVEIKDDLKMTQRAVGEALYDLQNRNLVELDYPSRFPLKYKAVS
jgi:predicted transcriptional regulator